MMESMKLAQDLEAAREAVKSLPPMQAELRAAKLRRAYPALRPSEGNIKVLEAPLRGARGSHGV